MAVVSEQLKALQLLPRKQVGLLPSEESYVEFNQGQSIIEISCGASFDLPKGEFVAASAAAAAAAGGVAAKSRGGSDRIEVEWSWGSRGAHSLATFHRSCVANMKMLLQLPRAAAVALASQAALAKIVFH